MREMVKDCIREYKDTLENRERTYNELSKGGRRLVYLSFVAVLSGILFILIGFQFPSLLPYGVIGYFAAITIGALVALIGRFVIKSKGVPSPYFSPDEQIFLRVFDALVSLETYLKENLEPARFQSLKELQEAYRIIEDSWDPSQIGVVMKEIGKEIEAFKEGFDRNLIFTLEHGTETEKVHEILTEFADYLRSPSNVKLTELKEKMDSLPRSKKPRPRYPTIERLKRHQVHKHSIVIAFLFAIGLVPALLVVYYGRGSLVEAVLAFVTIFGPLAAVYLNHMLKRE